MRRYWQRIDYVKVKKQKPHKPKEFQKTKFDDVPLSEFNFDGLPDEIIRMIFRRKRKLQLRILFLEKNYIKVNKNFQKDSKKYRNFNFYKRYHIIYFLYLIYYNLDAMLYYFQLFFGYFGDKKFRKFVRKIAFFIYFKHFRLFLYTILYYSISLPIRFFIYQKFYHFIRFVFHKRWLRFKQKLWFELEERTSKLRGNFWYDYNQKVSEQKKELFETYVEMYTYPYKQYYKGWRKWVIRFRESGAFFIIEFQDLYAYFAGLSFVTWVVEFYYILYNIIFFFYPFVIPFIFFIPFFLFTKFYLLNYLITFNSILVVSFLFYFIFICVIFILLTIEITKYYLVKMSVESIDWYSLKFGSKIIAMYNCFKHFFFLTKLHKITIQRIHSRFFYYHDLTKNDKMTNKNAQILAKDEKRKDFFFKKSKLFPHISPRIWCQYGKCLYKKQTLGFGYIKNSFAGYLKINKFERKLLNYQNFGFVDLYCLSFVDFFWFFYNFLFLKFLNFHCLFFGFSKLILFEIFIFCFVINFFFIFCCFNLFFFTLVKFLMFKIFFIFIFLLCLFSIISYIVYKKYFISLAYTKTLPIYFSDKIDFIIFLFFFVSFLHLFLLFLYFLNCILF